MFPLSAEISEIWRVIIGKAALGAGVRHLKMRAKSDMLTNTRNGCGTILW